jgi:hypothetical protein
MLDLKEGGVYEKVVGSIGRPLYASLYFVCSYGKRKGRKPKRTRNCAEDS